MAMVKEQSQGILTGFVEMATPVGTTSATLEDVAGASVTVTLEKTSTIVGIASFEIATQSGAAPSTISVALSIDGTDHSEHARYLSGSNDQGIGALTHVVTGISAGARIVKLRMRRSAGAATPGINNASVTVLVI